MAIEQWGVISVQHLLWQGTSVYNGHFRGPVTVTAFALRLALEMSLFYRLLQVCRGWDSNTQPSVNGTNALSDCATAAAHPYVKGIQVCLNDGPHPLSRWIDNEIAKIHGQNLFLHRCINFNQTWHKASSSNGDLSWLDWGPHPFFQY